MRRTFTTITALGAALALAACNGDDGTTDTATDADTPVETADEDTAAEDTDDGRSVVSATLHNNTSDEAESVRVIVTLKDDEGHVVGYRVSSVTDYLAAGESVPVQLSIVAQGDVPEPAVEIVVEARRATPDAVESNE